jgi:D-inositol-3-phosphate glycosyltransferase
MRWALLGPLHPYRGGIAHYGALLAEELARQDETHAFNFSRLYPKLLFPGKTQYDESDSPFTMPAPRLLGSLDPLSWRRTASAIADAEPDALVCHWWHPFFGPAYGSVLRRLGKLRPECARLLLCHNVLPHERSRVDLLLGRRALGAADGFLVHSESDAENLRELLPGAPMRVHPHPRYEAFAGDAPDRETARAQLGIGPDEKVALFFGYVRAYKGLDLALRALALCKEPGLRLWVVGEFYEDRAPYDSLINELGLDDRVRIVDRYVANEEVAAYFQAADLVLQPYRSATQSGIAQIAFAFGKPVLATAVGGLPEQIEDGVSGLLVPPDDLPALATAMDRYFSDPALAARLAKGIAAAAARFSWRGLAGSLRELVAAVRP